MYYITVKQSPVYHHMALEELLSGEESIPHLINTNTSNTKTYEVSQISQKFRSAVNTHQLIAKLHEFNAATQHLREVPRKSLYSEFYIPKRSGNKWRKIDKPNDDLMNSLRWLKSIFDNDFNALYHTSAFAYVKKRCAVDAVKRHQNNNSKWFGKYDLSDFFGSTTLEFVMYMFSMVYPFCLVAENDNGRKELHDALELAFLDGGLPQGTPISPLITNIMMIPVDYKLCNSFRNFNNQTYVYTRYADDFLISSRYDFNFRDVEQHIVDVLNDFKAPFSIKSEKTRYGSSSGRNWNLGVMLNANNEITVGHKKKKQFQAMVSQFILDYKNGKHWDKNDIQIMQGLYAYYRSVEGETIDRIINFLGDKFGADVLAMIKQELAV